MNRKVGKVAWSSPALNNNTTEETKKLPFLDMKGWNKSWKGRVVSEDPLRYWCHFTTDKTGKSVKVNCTLSDDCPVMIEKTKTPCGGLQAEARYYIKLLDRADGKIKVLDVGKQVVNAIGELISNPEYGHCRNYDITINKGKEKDNPLYKVVPARSNAPLTAEEAQLVANTEDPDHEDFMDLEARIQPLTIETVRKILGLAEATASSPKKEGKIIAAPAKTSSKNSKDEEFDDIDWGDDN
jgi:hypothetical protein